MAGQAIMRIPYLPRFLLLHALLLSALTAQTGPVAPSPNPGPVYRWTTLAGRASVGSEDGPAADARFNHPHGLALDPSGNLYVADTGNHTIRKVTPAGIVSTFAGKLGEPGSTDGPVANARFNAPEGLRADAAGNLYVADTGNHVIRKITPAGTVITLAGQAGKPGVADGPAASALFEAPSALAVDSKGTVYVEGHGQRVVRKIAGGVVSTLSFPQQTLDLEGKQETFYGSGLPAIDAADRLYFRAAAATTGVFPTYRVIRVDGTGAATIVSTPSGYSSLGWGDPGIFNDLAGNIYLTHSLRGWGGTPGFYLGVPMGPDGSFGPGGTSFVSIYGSIDDPRGIAVNPSTGRWYYTRESDHAILDDTRAVVAGTRGMGLGVDGRGGNARFALATSLTLDPAGSAWLLDEVTQMGAGEVYGSYALRKVSPAGDVTTPVPPRFIVEKSSTYAGSVAADGAGQVTFSWYFFSLQNLSRIDPATGVVSEFARPLTSYPIMDRIAVNPAGLLVGTTYDGKIHRIGADGTRSLLAGGGGGTTWQDGTGAQATFGTILGLTADARGDFYLLDSWIKETGGVVSGECHVRKITPAGVVTTVARNVAKPGPGGFPIAPSGVAIDSRGAIYLSYAGATVYGSYPSGWSSRTYHADNSIRRITPEGEDTTIAASPGLDGSSDGTTATARFASPSALAVDRQDNLYVIDGYGTTLRKGEFLGYLPGITTQPQSLTVAVGGSVQFSVAASGTPAPSYQWYFNGNPFSGATTSTLSFTNARVSDAGDYTVVITNALGSVTSAKATLTVTTAPNPPPSSGGTAGGGGAPSSWFLFALLTVGAGRKWFRAGNTRTGP
jgi:hypothetical protein